VADASSVAVRPSQKSAASSHLSPSRAAALRRGLVPAPSETIGASYHSALTRAAITRDDTEGVLSPSDLPAMVLAGGDLTQIAYNLTEAIADAANSGDDVSRSFICAACAGGVLPGALLSAVLSAAQDFEAEPRDENLELLEARVRTAKAVLCFPAPHPIITNFNSVETRNCDASYVVSAADYKHAAVALMCVWRTWHALRCANELDGAVVERSAGVGEGVTLVSRSQLVVEHIHAIQSMLGWHNPPSGDTEAFFDEKSRAVLPLYSSQLSLSFWCAVLRSIGKTDAASLMLFQWADFPSISRLLLNAEPARARRGSTIGGSVADGSVSDAAAAGSAGAAGAPDVIGTILDVLSATTHSALTLERCTGFLAVLCGGDDEELAHQFRRSLAERDALLLLQPALLSPSPALMLRTCFSIALIASDSENVERAERSGVLGLVGDILRAGAGQCPCLARR
jgi:hypothetical protein